MSKPKRRNVTFELPEAEWDLLLAETERIGNGSHHQRAREILLYSLNNAGIMNAEGNIEQQSALLEHIIELLRRLAYTLLANVTGDRSSEASETAKRWVDQHMRRKPE